MAKVGKFAKNLYKKSGALGREAHAASKQRARALRNTCKLCPLFQRQHNRECYGFLPFTTIFRVFNKMCALTSISSIPLPGCSPRVPEGRN